MPFVTGQFDTISGFLESLYDKHIENFVQITDVTGNAILDGYHSNVPGSSSSSSSSYLPSTGVSARFYLDTFNNASPFGSSFRGRRFRGTPENPSGVLKDDTILHFSADGYASTGINSAGGVMLFASAEDWNTSGNGAYFRLRLTPSGAMLPVDRIWIKENGNVGLSNVDPQYTLDVSGSGNFTSGLYVNGVSVVLSSQTGSFGGSGGGNSPPVGYSILKSGDNITGLNYNNGDFLHIFRSGEYITGTFDGTYRKSILYDGNFNITGISYSN